MNLRLFLQNLVTFISLLLVIRSLIGFSVLQVLRVVSNDSDADLSDLPSALTRPPSKANMKSDLRRNVNPKYRVDELNEPSTRLPGIRSLLPLPGGDLLTGGTDLKIRRWDHCRF